MDSTPQPQARSLIAATLWSLFFVLFIGPGPVIVLVPWLLCGWEMRSPFLGFVALWWLGAVLIVAGAPWLVNGVLNFVRRGRGTPAPWQPTNRLVVSGPYRYVRNPMYVGVVSMILGQALLFASIPVLIYATMIFIGFNLFVFAYEEPHLRRVYGADYEAYCRVVPRWIPRPPARAAN